MVEEVTSSGAELFQPLALVTVVVPLVIELLPLIVAEVP